MNAGFSSRLNSFVRSASFFFFSSFQAFMLTVTFSLFSFKEKWMSACSCRISITLTRLYRYLKWEPWSDYCDTAPKVKLARPDWVASLVRIWMFEFLKGRPEEVPVIEKKEKKNSWNTSGTSNVFWKSLTSRKNVLRRRVVFEKWNQNRRAGQ